MIRATLSGPIFHCCHETSDRGSGDPYSMVRDIVLRENIGIEPLRPATNRAVSNLETFVSFINIVANVYWCELYISRFLSIACFLLVSTILG